MASAAALEKDGTESNEFQDVDESKGKGKKKKIVKILILLILFLSIIGGAVAVLVFNVFDIRDTYLRSFLEEIPIVNTMLPPLEAIPENVVTQMSNAELTAALEELQNQLDIQEFEISHLSEINSIQSAEIVRLQEIEDNQLQFRADQEAFDRMIAENNPDAFMAFFESMDPENAEILYNEAVTTAYRSAEVREFISTIESMDRRRAALTLEDMMETELDLVVAVMSHMNVAQRAIILNSMSTEHTAVILTMLAPEDLI